MYGIAVPNILAFLAFLVLGGVSYLIWWKAKAPAALLMLVGFGANWVIQTLWWLGVFNYNWYDFAAWVFCIGLAVAALGFALTFWTKIQADVERFSSMARDKLAQAAKKGAGEQGTPPAEKSEKPKET